MAAAVRKIMTRDDILPEADSLEGFPHPRETASLYGHEDAEELLVDSYLSGRLHHAWLLSGPEGIGKATLAYRFGRFLLSRNEKAAVDQPDGLAVSAQSIAGRQVCLGAHPNMLVLRRNWNVKTKKFTTTIPVDTVRQLGPFLGSTAAQRGWRVIIIDRADDMNASAANAVLKSLEEPPDRCVFLLVSSETGRLPVTIRSRCRRLNLGFLNRKALQSSVIDACHQVDHAVPADEKLLPLLDLADGSARRALELVGGHGAALYDELKILLGALPDIDYAAVHKLSDRISGAGKENDFAIFYSMLSNWLSTFIRAAAIGEQQGADEKTFETGVGQPSGITGLKINPKDNLAQWAELWETLTRMKAEAQLLNLDRKNLVLDVFRKLELTALSSKSATGAS